MVRVPTQPLSPFFGGVFHERIVAYVNEPSVSDTYATVMHVAGFVKRESSTFGDAVRQYAVLELSEDAIKAYKAVVR